MEGDRLAQRFDAVEPFTVGIEEEVMLLDPETLELADVAPALVSALADRRPAPKLELPASQVELVSAPRRTVAEAISDVADGRRALLAACSGVARPAAAGAHPFSPAEGGLNQGPRYARVAAEYGWSARRQRVCALQVHVAIGGAERTLAVYNGLRAELPALAALAANAPAHEGRDSGLASIRPLLARLLPRQGTPPPLASWDELAGDLDWGATTGRVPEPASWWWDLRPHLGYGTLELRVPDAQTTLGEAAAVAAVAHGLAVELAERHDAGERFAAPPTWRIDENRWVAARHGLDGAFADPLTGAVVPVREHLERLVDRIAPVGARIGAEGPLTSARALIRSNGALAQRAVLAERGPRELATWLADRFDEGLAACGDWSRSGRVTARP
jgi:carboxylate-amine ligase